MSIYRFPFLDERYVRAYSSSILLAPALPVPLIGRAIPGTQFIDAQLPWPYVNLGVDELKALARHHPQVVSIVGVLLPPGGDDCGGCPEAVPLKPHFLFDPSRAQTPLSGKSRANLADAGRVWAFREGGGEENWLSFRRAYSELVARRQLSGTSFDFPPSHFAQLAALPSIRLLGVHDGREWGAMICAAEGGGELHMIHLVVSEVGLRTNASYALMQSLIDRCADGGTRLYLGGVPAGDNGGVLKFKSRWSNRTLGSWLFRLIVRPDVYEALAIPGNVFFPAYRNGW